MAKRQMALPLGGFVETEGCFPHPGGEEETYDYEPSGETVDTVMRRFSKEGYAKRTGSKILKVANKVLRDLDIKEVKVRIKRPSNPYADAALEAEEGSVRAEILLHPIMVYVTDDYIKEVIIHEVSHL